MNHLQKFYSTLVKHQPIAKKEHFVNFGKTKSTIDITITENGNGRFCNGNDQTIPISGLDTGSNLKSEFDESDYMDPPIKSKDNYFWLRDDSRKNPDVLNLLNSENDLVDKLMEPTKELQAKLYNEIKSYVKESYDSLPIPSGNKGWNSDYYHWVRTEEGKSYPIHMRTKQSDQSIETLLDENLLAKGHNTFDLTGFEITNDHKYMSYGLDLDGSENYELKIIDIKTKTEIAHTIPQNSTQKLSYCDYFWYEENGSYYIYYILHNETRRAYKLMRYDLKNLTHLEIFSDQNPLFEVSAGTSDDNRYIMISSNSSSTHNVYMFENNKPSELKNITERRSDHKYSVEIHNSTVFIITNKDGATNFKIMRCDISDTNESKWQSYMEYDQKVNIRGIKALKDYLLILYKTNGNSHIKVVPVENNYDLSKSYDIKVPNVESINLVGLDIYDTHDIIITYQDLKRPSTMTKYNLPTKIQTILRTREVPNYNQALYHTERLYAVSHDGKQIPISLIYRKDNFKADGSNPLYLYGYGSYGITIDPTFKSSILPLLDRGFVYAIAHVRGGSFLGTEWYEDGKMLKKMNTFKDFISCAEHLISTSYTSTGNIVIEGRSAGGLLVGAALTMRPELFKTVIAGVPFVDVLNTMCDPMIPLTTPEWEEWGNPNKQIYYDYMKQYSPYDNIKENTSYPNILALGGLNDPRVQYWEPAKFIAKLREYDSDPKSGIKILKTEMEQGHFGNTDRYKYIKETAFNYAFVFYTFDKLFKIKIELCDII
jgi:oligopeptidase B